MQRFTGTVQELSCVSVDNLAHWIAAIPLKDWPQQRRDILMPAMVNDLAWHDFGKMAAPVVEQAKPPGSSEYGLMLSTVMPGHRIDPHKDEQPPYYIARIHVPLATNKQAAFIVEGKPFYLQVGRAYFVNTMREHAVKNDGKTPRIHLMFDIRWR